MTSEEIEKAYEEFTHYCRKVKGYLYTPHVTDIKAWEMYKTWKKEKK